MKKSENLSFLSFVWYFEKCVHIHDPLPLQLNVVTIGGNRLIAELSGLGFLIVIRQRLLQTAALEVAQSVLWL